MINVYTDGAYSPNRDCGGWAFYIPELHVRVVGNKEHTTINQMELTAAIKALEFISDSNLSDKEITIYSDSMYLVGGASLGWSTAVNTDLWDQLQFIQSLLFDKTLHFVHVDGHSGNKGNEIVDQLAVKLSHMKEICQETFKYLKVVTSEWFVSIYNRNYCKMG